MVYYCLTNITRGIQTASPAAKGATAATAANRIRRTREAIDATSERVVEKKSPGVFGHQGPTKIRLSSWRYLQLGIHSVRGQ